MLFPEGCIADRQIDGKNWRLRVEAIERAVAAHMALNEHKTMPCGPQPNLNDSIRQMWNEHLIGYREKTAFEYIRDQANLGKHGFVYENKPVSRPGFFANASAKKAKVRASQNSPPA